MLNKGSTDTRSIRAQIECDRLLTKRKLWQGGWSFRYSKRLQARNRQNYRLLGIIDKAVNSE